ncbi:MAG: adenylate/guanylate cyclase domain-containing protein, partial [Nocardioides sp.]
MPACPGCCHDNAPLSKFCVECGLANAPAPCAACGTTPQPGQKFCAECGDALTRTDTLTSTDTVGGRPLSSTAPGRSDLTEGHRKTVTALFSDLVGSTSMQERLDPETGRRLMRRYYDLADDVVRRFHGHLDGWAGDGLCAVWGVPEVAEDDAWRALQAAAALLDGVTSLNIELERDFGIQLRTRTGLNSGEVVVGSDRRLVGDMMNTAARLEAGAPVGGILLGEPTWRLVRHRIEFEEVEPIQAKGKSAPVRAFRVIAMTPARPMARTPYAGRTHEQRRLHRAWTAALQTRSCRLVSVIGSPGLGKSRLAEEVAATVRESGG